MSNATHFDTPIDLEPARQASRSEAEQRLGSKDIELHLEHIVADPKAPLYRATWRTIVKPAPEQAEPAPDPGAQALERKDALDATIAKATELTTPKFRPPTPRVESGKIRTRPPGRA